jgi:hypothetical protein
MLVYAWDIKKIKDLEIPSHVIQDSLTCAEVRAWAGLRLCLTNND